MSRGFDAAHLNRGSAFKIGLSNRHPARLTGMRLSLALLATAAFGIAAESFPPADVAILGDIDYGKKSADLECSGKPRYCALVFNGKSGDVVEVTVSGGERKPFVALPTVA